MFRPALISALLCAPTALLAATVEIASGPIYVNSSETDDETTGAYRFRITQVSIDSSITWISGDNQTDGVVHPQQSWTEDKFTLDEQGGIGARGFTGFKDNDGPGPFGSTTTTQGSGESRSDLLPDPAGVLPFVQYNSARFKISANGTLGDVPNMGDVPVVVDYIARADAHDPMIVKGAQLAEAGLARGGADVFFAFALYALDLSGALPGLGAYATASAVWSVVAGGAMTSVLSLAFDAAGDAVLSSAPGVHLFLLDSLDSPPPVDVSQAVDLGVIEALLRGEIDPDGRLDTPRFFGALVEDALYFDDSIPEEEAFRVTADSSVTDPAMKIGYVPVPPAAAMLFLGLCALGAVAGQRRRPAGVPAC